MTLAVAPRASSRPASGRFLATRAQLGVDTSEPMHGRQRRRSPDTANVVIAALNSGEVGATEIVTLGTLPRLESACGLVWSTPPARASRSTTSPSSGRRFSPNGEEIVGAWR
jgi:hypothetical protein